MNTKSSPGGGLSSLLALLLLCVASVTLAQDARLRSPGWERIVEVRDRNRGGDEVFFMPRNDGIAGFASISTDPRKVCVINIVGPIELDEMALLDREFHLTRCGRSN